MVEDIKGFTDHNRWLSNFQRAVIDFEGLQFPSVEHAYVFAKFSDQYAPTGEDFLDFLKQSAGSVKRLGRAVVIRSDFDSIKLAIMTSCIKSKFSSNNPELTMKLLATGNCYIEETNSWGDTFWGKDMHGNGLNHLGVIIMARRAELAILTSERAYRQSQINNG